MMKPSKKPAPNVYEKFLGPHGVYLFIPATILFVQLITAYKEMAKDEDMVRRGNLKMLLSSTVSRTRTGRSKNG